MGMARSTVMAVALVALVATWTSLGDEANAQGRGGRGRRWRSADVDDASGRRHATGRRSVHDEELLPGSRRTGPTSVTRDATHRGS